MNIICPGCGYKGSIPDSKAPTRRVVITCKSCKHRFPLQSVKSIAVIPSPKGREKSTTCVNLGMGYSLSGFKTLIVDLDSKGLVGSILGVQPPAGLTEFATAELTARQTIAKARTRLWLLAGGPSVAGLERVALKAGENLDLFDAILRPLEKHFDYIVLNGCREFPRLLQGIIAYAQELVIPVLPHVDSLLLAASPGEAAPFAPDAPTRPARTEKPRQDPPAAKTSGRQPREKEPASDAPDILADLESASEKAALLEDDSGPSPDLLESEILEMQPASSEEPLDEFTPVMDDLLVAKPDPAKTPIVDNTLAPKEFIPSDDPMIIVREPVFDRHDKIHGYRLAFAHPGGTGGLAYGGELDAKALPQGFHLSKNGFDASRMAFLEPPHKAFFDDTLLHLPPGRVLYDLNAGQPLKADFLLALDKLKEAGYRFSASGSTVAKAYAPYIKMLDVIAVDVSQVEEHELVLVFNSLQPYGVKLLAMNLNDMERYSQARNIGFEYFHGDFYRKPKLILGYELPPLKLHKFQLLRELSNEDYETKEVARIISLDSSLSYRLLRYINSAHFSLMNKIKSVEQALTMLGQRQLMKWLQVVVMYELATSPKAQEVTYQSVKRGRFLEILSSRIPCPAGSDSLFLLGLFSQLDVLLEQPMRDLMEKLPLDETLKDALIGNRNDLTAWLKLARLSDNRQFQKLEQQVKSMRVDMAKVVSTLSDAVAWTNDILSQVD